MRVKQSQMKTKTNTEHEGGSVTEEARREQGTERSRNRCVYGLNTINVGNLIN